MCNAEKLGGVEFENHLNNLKTNKAVGKDSLKAEALKFADESSKSKIGILMEDYLNGNSIPDSWRDSIIWPIHKKGPKKAPENYRGITLSNSIYKLYARILNSRSEKFVKDENILPETHKTDFGKRGHR